MNEEVEKTREALNTLVDQKEPQSAAYSLRLIVLMCVIIIALLFGMFYLLSSNLLVKHNEETVAPASFTTPTISSTAPLPPIKARFEIITGSVYRTLPGEKRKLLVDQKELQVPKELNLKILEIVSYKVSPDLSHIVVMGNVGQTQYALFDRNILTSETDYMDLAQDAAWSADNRYVALRKGKTDIGPYYIVVYDTQTKEMANIKFSKELDSNNTTYGQMLWAIDKPELVAEYSLFGEYPYNQKEQGTVTITVK
jgi:hypothetical protein